MRRAAMMVLATTGLLGLACQPATAAPAPRLHTKHFSAIESGVLLSSTGLRFEDVYRIKRSPDGIGAAVRDGSFAGTVFPVSGSDRVISSFKDGRQTATETFAFGTPRLDGVGTITGHGKCTGGTGPHQQERCAYAITGTYDLTTNLFQIALSGTDSRP